MRHPTEGVLRRLIDEPAGVAESDRRHVAQCPLCLGELAAAREDAALVGAALEPQGASDVDVAAAWRRLSATPPATGRRPRPTRSPGLLHRPAAVALAVVVVLTGASAASTRAASSRRAASPPRHRGQPATCSRSEWATPAGSSSSRRSAPSDV